MSEGCAVSRDKAGQPALDWPGRLDCLGGLDGLDGLDWRKARRSIGAGDCVEVAPANGKIFVRDSKNPGGPMLEYPAEVWRNFLTAARLGSLG